jgi:hypothetical protein
MLPESIRMSSSDANAAFPRRLRAKEWDLLESVLPADSPGYRRYRDLIVQMTVLGEGRRGKGNLLLGFEDDIPDISSPLASVIAYGIVETTLDRFSVTVREEVEEQIDIEIVSTRGMEIPDHFEEKRRWTYSSWRPGDPSPSTNTPVREIPITTDVVLGICKTDRRIWVHDRVAGMNLLIPVTAFHNELMLHKRIRDPNKALRSDVLFDDLGGYSDTDLRAAFIAYNSIKRKLKIATRDTVQRERWLPPFLRRMFGKKS